MSTRPRLQNSQLSNFRTYQMYLRQCLSLAENVFKYDNMPYFIDIPYMNKNLLRKGAIAFFYDEGLETVLCLPFVKYGPLDVYGRYTTIQAIGSNGYRRVLNPDEYVIMYDNNGQYPLYLDILQYAERLAYAQRTMDINISQQKTPRIWNVPSELEKTVRDLINNVDGFTEQIIAYKNLAVDKISTVSSPAPYVTDKIQDAKEKIWNEFLRLCGISNLSVQKKERNIRDEITANQGGTIASRFSRFEPRKKAIDEINKKFTNYLDKPIIVSYYDDLPTNLREYESEVNDDDISMDNDSESTEL